MEEIKVGDYIRTKEGEIGKVINTQRNVEANGTLIAVDTIVPWQLEMNIKKYSKNLIDLIEAGDIVNEKIVEEYSDIDDNGNEITELGVAYNEEDNLYLPLNTLDIETILTHEQYEQNCYKVEV